MSNFERLKRHIHELEVKVEELKVTVFRLQNQKYSLIQEMQGCCAHRWKYTGLTYRCEVCGKWSSPFVEQHNSINTS